MQGLEVANFMFTGGWIQDFIYQKLSVKYRLCASFSECESYSLDLINTISRKFNATTPVNNVLFRAIRKRTMQREEFLTKKKEESDLQKEFNKRVAENREKEEAKTAKKRLKRQKRKANKKKPKQEKVPSSEESDVEDDDGNVETCDKKTDDISDNSEVVNASLSNQLDDGTKTVESCPSDDCNAES